VHYLKAIHPILIILAITFIHVSPSHANKVKVAHFSDGSLSGWEEKSFVGTTQYQFVRDEGHQVLEAVAEGTASGFFREIKIDLNKTPYINWSWWIEETLQGNDEKSKAGDDYPVRIYVVASGGLFFWRTRAINYVWSGSQVEGSHWPNAYTARAMMVAVRSGNALRGQWMQEKRNVYEDLKLLFGREITQIDAVAIMSDADNSGGRVRARYGDIYFSAK